MTNVTISIDEQTLQRARIRALKQGTSVNALLRDYLESFAGLDTARRALQDFVKAAEESPGSSGPEGRT